MSASVTQRCSPKPVPRWHAGFLAMLPIIRQCAREAFARRDPESQQDLVHEVVVNALVAYVRLFQRGRVALAYPTVLARYGIAQVQEGRRVGNRLNVQDISSNYCQRRKGVTVERLDHFDAEENAWREAVLQDTRSAPVPETVAFRCDFADWLKRMPTRNRRIAGFLALGNRTGEAARKFQISEGRVSQLRRELARSWAKFGGQDGPVTKTERAAA